MTRELLYRFFALPAATAHESWFAFMPAELTSASKKSALGTLVLSRLLARRAELETPAELEVAAEHRWTLQEPSRLLATARKLGAISMGTAIAANIDRERVRMLKDALGDQLYREAVADTALRLTQAAEIPLQAWSSQDALREFIDAAGAALMLETLPVNGGLRRHAALKFPRAYADGASREVSDDDRRAVAAWLQTDGQFHREGE